MNSKPCLCVDIHIFGVEFPTFDPGVEIIWILTCKILKPDASKNSIEGLYSCGLNPSSQLVLGKSPYMWSVEQFNIWPGLLLYLASEISSTVRKEGWVFVPILFYTYSLGVILL